MTPMTAAEEIQREDICAEHRPLWDYLRDTRAQAYAFYSNGINGAFVVFDADEGDSKEDEARRLFPHVAVFSSAQFYEWNEKINEVISDDADRQKIRTSISFWLEDSLMLREVIAAKYSRDSRMAYDQFCIKNGYPACFKVAA